MLRPVHRSSLIVHPSSFILHRSSFIVHRSEHPLNDPTERGTSLNQQLRVFPQQGSDARRAWMEARHEIAITGAEAERVAAEDGGGLRAAMRRLCRRDDHHLPPPLPQPRAELDV